MRVLHVTESMTTGVLSVIASIANRQHEAGAEVSILYSLRPETPSRDNIAKIFHTEIALLDPLNGGRRGLLSLYRNVRAVLSAGDYDAVHLHSSLAGMIGRTANLRSSSRTRVFYSPHGFAFLRENTSRATRWVALIIERVLARKCNALILTAQSELDIASDQLHARNATYLQTGVPSEMIASAPDKTPDRNTITVAMVGRVAFQKAPWTFASVARELCGLARFIWIGDGAERDIQMWLGDSPVSVTGWLSPEDLATQMEKVDILLFPSLWEGKSLSLIQAQAQGIPAVVTDVVGNRDTILNGKTGFVCRSEGELIERTRQLVSEPETRGQFSLAARHWALESLTDDNVGLDSLRIYDASSKFDVQSEGHAR